MKLDALCINMGMVDDIEIENKKALLLISNKTGIKAYIVMGKRESAFHIGRHILSLLLFYSDKRANALSHKLIWHENNVFHKLLFRILRDYENCTHFRKKTPC